MEHPEVSQAVVIAREDNPGDKRLVGYYMTAEGQEVTVETLRMQLAQSLPDYMVPAAYVRLQTLPLTPNGKLDRKALPAPDGEAYATSHYEAPLGPVETAIAAIWAEILKLERVGRHDNFFTLGGHSLLAVRSSVRSAEWGIHIPLWSLFKHPTICELARGLDDDAGRALSGRTLNRSVSPPSSVILVRAGGAHTLFLFPALGGGLSYYNDLIGGLDERFTIYGLNAFSEHLPQALCIEDVGRAYAEEIKPYLSDNNYYCGYSFGGYLATETARRLLESKQGLGTVVLLDSRIVESDVEEVKWPHFVNYFFDPEVDDRYLLTERDRIREAFDSYGALLAMLQSSRRREHIQLCETLSVEVLRAMFRVFKRNVEAVRTYVPEPFSGSTIRYLACRVGDDPISTADDAPWIACKNISIPATHSTIVRLPAARLISDDLNRRCGRV